ncbi:HAMP domain-containing sensor histidine kinase [Hydrogenophaga sp.]|uniref:sensor histidine kinase n=1 Tax=Hydrogenophaga sp. TaxID=1904254 RepID=UPI0027322204|nr:HAMP domain-containing sensor histidine kinase [Hydrogenophaga sp.]MDP1687369.1 HAMP domain-containing sensor histidine kinase [Hydrogenophaga sp.]
MTMPAPGVHLPSLWRYLWSWVVGALLVVWTTLLLVAWYTGHHEAEEITDGQLEAVARLWLSVEPDKTLSIPEPIASSRTRAYVQDVAVLHWVDGQLFTDTHNLAGSLGLSDPPAKGFSNRVQTTGHGEVRWRVYAAPGQDEHAADFVAVLMDLDHRVDLGRDMALKLARPALLVLPLVALLLWWALRRGLNPLVRLSRDVAALDGLGGQRLDTAHRFHEFSSTVRAINTLVDSLQAQARREREFASDVAHELRTPLAAMSLQASAAQHDPSPERLALLEANALRAGNILSQLLELARAQRDGTGREAWKDLSLGDVAAGLIASHAQEGFESDHELSLEQPEQPVVLHAQPMLLELSLRNLIENALRHTPAGTQVVVEVWQNASEVGVSVSDDGQRADAPRPAQAPVSSGLGLGLRLVQRLAEQLGATLHRDTGEAPMTTRFTLRWPR